MSNESSRGRSFDPDDYALSMRISPRAKRAEDNEDLRTLLVNRLSDTTKAVARISLRGGQVSVLCEACSVWARTPDDEFPLLWSCPTCRRKFEMEFAVLEEVNEHGEDGEEPEGPEEP